MGTTGRKQGRRDLSDAQRKLPNTLLPNWDRGGKWNDHRLMLHGIPWVLRTGAPWRELPERYGKWQIVYDRFNRWWKDGAFDRVLRALRIRLDKDGDMWCVDGSSVLASRSAAEAGGDHRFIWSLTVTSGPGQRVAWGRGDAG